MARVWPLPSPLGVWVTDLVDASWKSDGSEWSNLRAVRKVFLLNQNFQLLPLCTENQNCAYYFLSSVSLPSSLLPEPSCSWFLALWGEPSEYSCFSEIRLHQTNFLNVYQLALQAETLWGWLHGWAEKYPGGYWFPLIHQVCIHSRRFRLNHEVASAGQKSVISHGLGRKFSMSPILHTYFWMSCELRHWLP